LANTTLVNTSNVATAIAPISPVGGHGYDNVSELGCNHIMFAVEFNGSEGGVLPTSGVNYRQVGLLVDPQVYSNTGTTLATGSIYNTATILNLTSGTGSYVADEVVYQGPKSNPTFFGTVLSFNQITNQMMLINTTGVLVEGGSLIGSNDTRPVAQTFNPTVVPFSGYLTYIENRAGVQRSNDGIEQFKFVLGY
jgi:hypothetical protein